MEVHRLEHTYQRGTLSTLALAGLDLQVASGEFVCVLGPSGCGKSTLLRIVAGLLQPTCGGVAIAGQPPATARRQKAIGWMAQGDALLRWRNVASNVALPLEVGGGVADDIRRRAAEALELVGLQAFARHYPHQLSGGMRQRVSLARALVRRPGLLLLDEPFAHLDELTREELGAELLRLCAAYGPTVLMVTHSPVEAVRLAGRVVVMSPRPGRIVGEVRLPGGGPRDESASLVAECLGSVKSLLAQPRRVEELEAGLVYA